MSVIVRLIRNDPPKYPWGVTPREELRRRIDVRWRAYCLTQSAAALVDALASANQPFVSPKERRSSCRANLARGHVYLNMAAKRFGAS